MTVRLNEAGVIVIEGKSPVEDAEILLEHLHTHPSATIDCSGCHFMHTAVVQVLMAANPKMLGPCGDDFVRTWSGLGAKSNGKEQRRSKS
jgi:hypothetical protein